MYSKSLRTVSILALLILSLSPLSAQAQDKQVHAYAVKYVCGNNEHGLNSTSSYAAAGGYRTEINIQRAKTSGEARIEVLPSVVRSVFSESRGLVGRTHPTTLVGGEAVRVTCQDINGLIDGTMGNQFRVGFLRISSFEPLSVVAVYTAKHCRSLVGASYVPPGGQVCDGDIALDVVRYDPALVEPIKDDSKSPTIPF